MNPKKFFVELKRRNVYKVAFAQETKGRDNVELAAFAAKIAGKGVSTVQRVKLALAILSMQF